MNEHIQTFILIALLSVQLIALYYFWKHVIVVRKNGYVGFAMMAIMYILSIIGTIISKI